MRVALFFDGKNFYSGYKDQAGDSIVDFTELAQWLLFQVQGSTLMGAHYYTGIETEPHADQRLKAFLDKLEIQPGFFVYRFPRKKRSARCHACRERNTYSTEKEVDTTMVADMLRLAAVNAFDTLILLSGDSDHAPAIEGVRALGKLAYVATWGGSGLSSRLRRAAFNHIDLKKGIEKFAKEEPTPPETTVEPTTTPINDGAVAFLAELENAEKKFATGHVGVHYFTTKWGSTILEESPIIRRRILQRLLKEGSVELYTAPNGDKALRRMLEVAEETITQKLPLPE